MGKRKPDHAANRAHARAFRERQSKQRIARAEREAQRTRPSEVTVTGADGTVQVMSPLSPLELRKIVKERPPIPLVMRQRILARDNHRCRYCGIFGVPLEMEHVVPVALGGATTYSNIVTACRLCNSNKGTQVWKPRPL